MTGVIINNNEYQVSTGSTKIEYSSMGGGTVGYSMYGDEVPYEELWTQIQLNELRNYFSNNYYDKSATERGLIDKMLNCNMVSTKTRSISILFNINQPYEYQNIKPMLKITHARAWSNRQKKSGSSPECGIYVDYPNSKLVAYATANVKQDKYSATDTFEGEIITTVSFNINMFFDGTYTTNNEVDQMELWIQHN